MKVISRVFLALLILGVALFLIWLHDIRRVAPRSELNGSIQEKLLVIARLEEAIVVLNEYSGSDDPANTKLVKMIREEHPDITDEEFAQWYRENKAEVDAGVENDTKALPLAIEQHKADIERTRKTLSDIGSPWIFFRD